MTYIADEQSVFNSQPIELFRFTSPSQVWYLTSYNRKITFLGQIYLPVAGLSRSAHAIPTTDGTEPMTVSLPYEHDLALRCLRPQPPREILLDVFRYQIVSAEYRKLWSGYVAGASVTERLCSIRIPSIASETLDTPLPGWSCSRLCNHLLYSANCGAIASAFGATVLSVSGRVLTIGSALSPATADWFVLGEVVHATSTERRRIVSHGTTTLTLDYEFFSLTFGDVLSIYPGCDHTLTGIHGCRQKFNNVVNFGGHPHNSTSNPFELGLSTSKKD